MILPGEHPRWNSLTQRGRQKRQGGGWKDRRKWSKRGAQRNTQRGVGDDRKERKQKKDPETHREIQPVVISVFYESDGAHIVLESGEFWKSENLKVKLPFLNLPFDVERRFFRFLTYDEESSLMFLKVHREGKLFELTVSVCVCVSAWPYVQRSPSGSISSQ